MKSEYGNRLKNIIIGKILFFSLVLLHFFSGCKSLIEIEPPVGDIIGDEIYNSNANAISVLTGIYADMSSYGIFTGISSIGLRTGLSADELIPTTNPSSILYALYTNGLTNNGDQLFWADLYAYVFRVNAAIEGVSKSKNISSVVRSQLLGEALFLRAYYYFYLVNLYGDVPLLTSTDVKVNASSGRAGKALVYEKIIEDLKSAKDKLNFNYVSSDVVSTSNERIRPNKSTATALLAKVYLYKENWDLAESEASEIISDPIQFSLEELDKTFLSYSREAIWQLQPVVPSLNTLEAKTYVLAAGQGIPAGGNADDRPVYLSFNIYNAFEIGDQRKKAWVDTVRVNGMLYPYVNKYKVWFYDAPLTEALTIFRLGEVYLIRAEARAQQGKLTGSGSAEEDLNIIRHRAGLPNIQASGREGLIDAILRERKLELFTEGGNRWFDLKRSGKIDQIMSTVSPQKGGSWASYKSLYPIPVMDIQRNPNLKGHQNIGYPEL